jgi:Transposase DDE domain
MRKSFSSLRKSLTLDGLIKDLGTYFSTIKDSRKGNSSYSLRDVLMTGYAIFSLKYPSLLNLESRTEITEENLKKVYGLGDIISDSGLRKVLDNVSWRHLRHYFLEHFKQLKKLGIVQNFRYLKDYNLVSIDGVEYFNSKKIHCPCCLEKKLSNGDVLYSHSMLCAAMVHPKAKDVFILGAEPIEKQDGQQKNDCEQNALKRMMNWFSTHFKEEKLIFLQDALFGTAPAIGTILANHWDFIISAKQGSHESLYKSFEQKLKIGQGLKKQLVEQEGKTYEFHWMNNQPLNGSHPDIRVNFLHCKETDKKGKVQIFSWITSLEITAKNVLAVMEAGRSRWKIENETFNTLKNQGYQFEHNYGHGYECLSNVFAMLMLIAFTIDQLVQHCSQTFQVLWKVSKTKVKLWENIRGIFFFKSYENFAQLYQDLANAYKVKLE